MTRAIFTLPLAFLSLACTEVVEVSVYSDGCCDEGCEEEEDSYCEELLLEVEDCWASGGHPELCADLEQLFVEECEGGGDEDCGWGGCEDDCEDRDADGRCDEACEDRDADGQCDDDCEDRDEAGECQDEACAQLEEAYAECMSIGVPEACEDILWMLEETCWS